jgi:replication initiation protein RepC
MSLTAQTPNQLTGARRLSITMLTARDRADGFIGLPPGTAKPLRFLAAFQEAEPYLGLPAHAFKLVSWLVKQTMPCDWERGSRPIAWPSARRQQEFLGLSAARVKMLNRVLFDAGIFVIRDNEQGKRYGRRSPDNHRIIEAWGFDLSPLALRYDEFVRIAGEAKAERERMRGLRKRVTIARRAIRQAGEALAVLGPLPEAWQRLELETAELIVAGRHAGRSEELALVAKALERRQTEAEQWLRDACKSVEIDPSGLANEPHTTSTNLPSDLEDTVMAGNESRAAGPDPSASPPPSPQPSKPRDKVLHLSASQLIDLAPRLGQYVLAENPTWRDVIDAAGGRLRDELGISPSLWGEACQTMGRDEAAVALAIVSTKPEEHFTRSAGGYFAGMVRKAERRELHLDRTVWALREARWGKATRRTIN